MESIDNKATFGYFNQIDVNRMELEEALSALCLMNEGMEDEIAALEPGEKWSGLHLKKRSEALLAVLHLSIDKIGDIIQELQRNTEAGQEAALALAKSAAGAAKEAEK